MNHVNAGTYAYAPSFRVAVDGMQAVYWSVFDSPAKKVASRPVLLERYFHDVYHFFLRRMLALTKEATVSEEEKKKLRALFEEVLRIKDLLGK